MLTPTLRRWAIFVLALAGCAVSGYMAYTRLSGAQVVCFGVGECETVSASRYGEIVIPIGLTGIIIPISLLGLGLYLTLAALASVPTGLWRTRADQALFGLGLMGVLYSAYLTYIELFVLYKICPWCVASAIIISAIWLLALPVGLAPAAEEDEELAAEAT